VPSPHSGNKPPDTVLTPRRSESGRVNVSVGTHGGASLLLFHVSVLTGHAGVPGRGKHGVTHPVE
jgi:hypothetical protein